MAGINQELNDLNFNLGQKPVVFYSSSHLIVSSVPSTPILTMGIPRIRILCFLPINYLNILSNMILCVLLEGRLKFCNIPLNLELLWSLSRSWVVLERDGKLWFIKDPQFNTCGGSQFYPYCLWNSGIETTFWSFNMFFLTIFFLE